MVDAQYAAAVTDLQGRSGVDTLAKVASEGGVKEAEQTARGCCASCTTKRAEKARAITWAGMHQAISAKGVRKTIYSLQSEYKQFRSL
jgi:hypothetical protein